MPQSESIWKDSQNARNFLERERCAVPGEDLQFSVISKIIQQWFETPSTIMDLGCGNGIIGRHILNEFPTAFGVFVDFSDTMLHAARENLKDNPDSIVIEADFSTHNWVSSIESLKPFDIIVSGFAIHHQLDVRKKDLYREIHELLSPGGIFLNLEHVASASHEVEKLFEEFYVEHLHNFQSGSAAETTRDEVAGFYKNRPDREEDNLAPVGTQCEWLRQIGYKDVDCFFKLFEIALFGGRK